MNREDQDIYRGIVAALKDHRPCALATVVATRGSTPRKNGARMLVEPGRGLIGTIGGGCGEALVIEAAREAIQSGIPRRVRVDLTDDPTAWSGSVCGGILDVFVEPVRPDPEAPGTSRSGSEGAEPGSPDRPPAPQGSPPAPPDRPPASPDRPPTPPDGP